MAKKTAKKTAKKGKKNAKNATSPNQRASLPSAEKTRKTTKAPRVRRLAYLDGYSPGGTNPIAWQGDTITDDGRIVPAVPQPKTQAEAKAILGECLRRAEIIYRDELTATGEASRSGVRKRKRSVGFSLLHTAQRIAQDFDLPIPEDPSPFRSRIKASLS